MGNIVKTAKCRFCGQMTQIEADEELTAAQAEEQATMTCNCPDAVEYQKEKQRNISKYNISAERAFLQSVRECRAETVILFEHLKQALASLKEDAEAAGEGYKYDALEAVYIKGKTYEDIVRETGCGRNSPKKWCKVMIQRLSIKLFGAKAIENDRNGVKTG